MQQPTSIVVVYFNMYNGVLVIAFNVVCQVLGEGNRTPLVYMLYIIVDSYLPGDHLFLNDFRRNMLW